MDFSSTGTSSSTFEATFRLTTADIAVAFDEQGDPDEQLWYDFSRKLASQPVSARLDILRRVALLIEGGSALASTLNLTAGAAEPK